MPGIGYSDDKLLQWRLQSYDDTQVRHTVACQQGLLPCYRACAHNGADLDAAACNSDTA